MWLRFEYVIYLHKINILCLFQNKLLIILLCFASNSNQSPAQIHPQFCLTMSDTDSSSEDPSSSSDHSHAEHDGTDESESDEFHCCDDCGIYINKIITEELHQLFKDIGVCCKDVLQTCKLVNCVCEKSQLLLYTLTVGNYYFLCYSCCKSFFQS